MVRAVVWWLAACLVVALTGCRHGGPQGVGRGPAMVPERRSGLPEGKPNAAATRGHTRDASAKLRSPAAVPTPSPSTPSTPGVEAAPGSEPHAYLLVDGVAMGGAIFAARRLNPEHQSLYEGLDERVFGEMSPHVFAYEKDSRFARLWLLLGRPRHWGVQLVSKASRAEVVAHLSRFLLVDYEDDKGHRDQVYLRFGDPRVMHTLLRALHPSQRSMFFGPIEQWIVADDEDPNRDVTYSLGEDGGLVAQSGDAPIPRIAPYDAVKEAKSPELGKDDALARSIIGRFGQLQALSSAHEGVVPFSSVCPCNEFEVGRRSELLIDRAQGKLFSVHSLRWYKHRLWAWLSGTAGKHLAPEALRQLIDDGVSVAAQYGIVSQSDVSDFVQLMLRLGPHFHRARSARVILNDSSLSPGEKLRRLKNRDRGARGPSSEEGPKPSRPE